jgi:hypothetical protein
MFIATKPKAIENFRTASMLVFAYISKVYCRASLQYVISPKLRVGSVASMSCYYRLGQVSSNHITFVPSSAKIGTMVVNFILDMHT